MSVFDCEIREKKTKQNKTLDVTTTRTIFLSSYLQLVFFVIHFLLFFFVNKRVKSITDRLTPNFYSGRCISVFESSVLLVRFSFSPYKYKHFFVSFCVASIASRDDIKKKPPQISYLVCTVRLVYVTGNLEYLCPVNVVLLGQCEPQTQKFNL